MRNAGVLMLLSAVYVSRIHFYNNDGGGGGDDGGMWVAVATWLLCCFVLCSAIRLLRSYDWLPGYTLYLLRCSEWFSVHCWVLDGSIIQHRNSHTCLGIVHLF